MKACDTDSWIDIAALKAWGAGAVGGYLGHNLTPQVAADAHAANVGLWSFWEGQSSNPDNGAPQGIADATTACDLADALGQPKDSAIYLPNDQIVTDEAATLAYFKAVAETIVSRGRQAGFYGQTSVWESVKDYGYKYFCHAPDGTPGPYPEANIVQSVSPEQTVAGMTVDVDELQSPFGGWNAGGVWPPAVVPPPDPKPDPKPDPPKEPDMDAAYLAEGTGYWCVVDPALKSKRTLPAQADGTALIKDGYKVLVLPAAFVDTVPEALR